LLLPALAFVTLNQKWSFVIGFLGIIYKPWRLFLVICSLLNLICVLVLIFVIPDSPKFTYSQGDEQNTLEIFRRIYRMNTGKPADSFEVSSIIKNEEFGEGSKESSQGFFKFMWSQTTPLFKGSHLRNILTACFLQFAVCNTNNGFWSFLPEVMNKISLWNEAERGSASVCEVFVSKIGSNSSSSVHCVQKLELHAYFYIFSVIITMAVCFTLLSLLINRIGKLIILSLIFIICGACAALLIFIRVPEISSYLYLAMLLVGLGISVVNASTFELFPTKMRSMAICVSMMTGRAGSVVGSLIIGSIIENFCSYSFIMPIVLMVSSLALSFTIPNISKRIK
jgi:MFS transporter, VNT family, synaptic vesicle glycoprotein 2